MCGIRKASGTKKQLVDQWVNDHPSIPHGPLCFLLLTVGTFGQPLQHLPLSRQLYNIILHVVLHHFAGDCTICTTPSIHSMSNVILCDAESQKQKKKRNRFKFHRAYCLRLYPVQQSRWRIAYCLFVSAVVVFSIHALICTAHLPLAQFSRKRKWSTPVASPVGQRWPQHSAPRSIYKDIITNNICVTDGQQLFLRPRNIKVDTECISATRSSHWGS